ncbi:hypothetical protein FZEAL_9403 [Fusarium zealandicum]|uniref:Uncharacterized protein n=1 Tax=Fusarium zealandicum TaxID=1053134 RepID=A0A8H4XG26_9HYPO|nr:hypothetical protein FZEAL_9403 [Fusarium zealandicum]
MRGLQIAWLLAGFLVTLSLAADTTLPPLGQWKIDESCRDHYEFLKNGFQDALSMAETARKSLDEVLQPRPKKSKEVKEWNRKYKNVLTMFGLKVDPKSGNKKTDEHFKQIYCKSTRDPSAPPALEKGEDGDNSAAVAQDEEDNKMKNKQKPDFDKGYVGAWYWKGRLLWKKKVPRDTTSRDPGSCSEPGVMGVTTPIRDMVQFCPEAFTDDTKGIPSPVGYTVDKSKTRLGLFTNSVSKLFLHEFAHYYGAESEGPGEPITAGLPDQQGLSADGKLIYLKKGKEVLKDEKVTGYEASGLSKKAVYGLTALMRLSSTKYKTEPGKSNSGPWFSTRTADSYALFAVME